MRNIITALLILISPVWLVSQNAWQAIQETETLKNNNEARSIIPDKFGLYTLNYKSMISQLSEATNERVDKSNAKTVNIDLPLPDGSMMTMTFVESPNMSPILSAKFPGIKSYRGYNPKNPSEHSRIDFGPMGFHAALVTRNGTIYIDPYYTFADDKYMSYYVKDHHVDLSQYANGCGNEHYNEEILKEEELFENPEPVVINKKSAPVIRKEYKLALACTGAWGSIWGTKDRVMANFNTGVNRFNIIFENEASIHFELVDDNDKLIFFNENEPYSEPSAGSQVLRENTSIINNEIGFGSYDIGHVFTTFCTDGLAGVAFSGSVCNANKGAGVSCVGRSNISNFIIQTGAHEIGHQFTGGHTWNNCPSSAPQRSPGTAWEPGSGSTIISYSGICGANNVQGPNDDYFHVGSIEQFNNFTENLSCGTDVTTDNNTPEIFLDIPTGLTIPISTPFELDGRAEDPDGDILTYNWEQMDVGPSSTLGSPIGNAPSFRSFPPNDETNRLFPRLSRILSGFNDITEVLPTYDRDLTFRFVVRDNHSGAGATVWEEVEFKSSDTAGPFVITSPRQLTFVEVNEEFTVEWDVANTRNTLINCQAVDIYLSTNGGATFDVLIEENVPNSGSHVINIPNNVTNSGRLKVKASNNIFFSIARGELIIRPPSEPGFFIDLSQSSFDVCLPESIEVGIIGSTFQGFENEVSLEVISGLPPNASFDFSNNPISADGQSNLNIDLSNVTESGIYEVTIEATADSAATILQSFQLEVTGTDMSDMSPLTPASGSAGITGTPIFEWSESLNAKSYTLEVSTSPEFGSTTFIREENIIETNFLPQVILDNSTLYYWRVVGTNECVEAFESEIFTLGTLSLSCTSYTAEDTPINISQTGAPSIQSVIQVFDQGVVSDVNIKKIRGGHGRARDLVATIINPAGDSIVLWENVCSGSNFNLGIDSESPLPFVCPLNSGLTLKPELGGLFDFNGSQVEGNWTLLLEDTRVGEGGRLLEFVIELCSSTAFDSPILVNNNVLEVPTGGSDKIFNAQLLSEDNNNTPEELLYTLVVNTQKGNLILNGNEMVVGSRFTQADIDSGNIRYIHNGSEDESDNFIFTVIDGEGGFIDLTEFVINTDASFTSSTDELGRDDLFRVFPNPVSQTLHIYNKNVTNSNWNVTIYNLDGQVVHTGIMNQRFELDVQGFSQGLYLVHLSDGNTYYTHKVNVIK